MNASLNLAHSFLILPFNTIALVPELSDDLISLGVSYSPRKNVALEVTAEYVLPIPEMVKIPAGKFIMGYLEERDEVEVIVNDVSHWAMPAHEVSVAALEMGKYPVTFESYDYFCIETNRPLPDDHGWGRGNLPVINVSWYDAKAYIDWLNTVTSGGWRLPTEAEWEYCARANSSYRFPWGHYPKTNRANYGETLGFTTEVGNYPANAFGLYDMHGNVWEWCEDLWHDNYYGAPTDGGAWCAPGHTNHVRRGGSWHSKNIASATRRFAAADITVDHLGFRVARDVVTTS